MREVDECDFAGCELYIFKTVRFHGLAPLSKFVGDTFDLCEKHYMEVLNYIYSKSRTAHLDPYISKEASR